MENNNLSHDALVEIYIKAWNTLDASVLEPYLAEDFTYGSMWVFSDLNGKDAYMEYISGKFNAIKESGSKVAAEKGISPQTGTSRVQLLQDGHRGAKIDVVSENGKMKSAYMHDL